MSDMQAYIEEVQRQLSASLVSFYHQPRICQRLEEQYNKEDYIGVINDGNDYLEVESSPVPVEIEVLVWTLKSWARLGERYDGSKEVTELAKEIITKFESPEFPTFHASAPFPYTKDQFRPFLSTTESSTENSQNATGDIELLLHRLAL